MRYIAGFIESIPMLHEMPVNRTQEQLELNNRVVIEVHSCNFRAVRGYTIAAAICDEVAFWRSDESANPDSEVLAAVRPALSIMPGSLLVCISSPYARRGALWEAYQKHYGVDDDPVLVWQGPTASMNPSIDPAVIEPAYDEDESAAAAEYGAEFRRDIETFVSREAVEACRIPGRLEMPFVPGVRYAGFTDPSGGSQDSYCLAIAHEQDSRAVLDCVRNGSRRSAPSRLRRNMPRSSRAITLPRWTEIGMGRRHRVWQMGHSSTQVTADIYAHQIRAKRRPRRLRRPMPPSSANNLRVVR